MRANLLRAKTRRDDKRGRFCGKVLELKSKNRQLGLNITAKTPVPSWLGERMDYSIAVEGLLRRE
ncbi:MAG: hypothetical protein EXR85_09705 [Xanthomonadales bacterium]|nr:hypothetical protein [Xanthomonadales bacterium]